jgi:hypothetical protein
MPGTAYEQLCVQPAPPGLRDLAKQVAALLRALHSWSVPRDLAEMLRYPEEDPDPLRRAGSEVVLLPPSAVLGLIPLAGRLPFVDHGVLDAAAWLAEDYPELFGSADLHRRLWLYALAYAIRQIIFWPPDRAEVDDLEVTHPLHTLRRLIDAPLPLAAGLP